MVLIGIGGRYDPGELEVLRAEVARLRAENAQLRQSPAALATEVQAAVKANDAERAKAALKRLTDRFPLSVEASHEGKRVDALIARQLAAQEEAQRTAALGFKALRTSPYFSHGDAGVGHDGHRRGRSNGDSTGTATAGNTSRHPRKRQNGHRDGEIEEPGTAVLGIGAYVANGAVLTCVGRMRYRFVRWRDYRVISQQQGDLRGMHFGYSSRILLFALGVSVTDEEAPRRQQVYLVATREGCHGTCTSTSGSRPFPATYELLSLDPHADHAPISRTAG